jgi:AraC-like DNA-binding protein
MAGLVVPGAEVERASGGQRIERHHHQSAYAALVLRGGYVEAGDRGRIHAEAGDVLFHQAFDGHFDCIGVAGADILNLPLATVPTCVIGRCSDPDSVIRVATANVAAAAEMLVALTCPIEPGAVDWPDMLARRLSGERPLRLDVWAGEHGLSPSALSRGFALAYGVTPKRFRLEQRGAAAARAIQSGAALSDAAFSAGFADQPHMTRTIGTLFARSPLQLRN